MAAQLAGGAQAPPPGRAQAPPLSLTQAPPLCRAQSPPPITLRPRPPPQLPPPRRSRPSISSAGCRAAPTSVPTPTSSADPRRGGREIVLLTSALLVCTAHSALRREWGAQGGSSCGPGALLISGPERGARPALRGRLPRVGTGGERLAGWPTPRLGRGPPLTFLESRVLLEGGFPSVLF